MAFNLSKRPNVKIGIDMSDYCNIAQRLRMPVAKIRGVDEVESAGSGFLLSSQRPKILFEGHLFYAHLKKKGLAAKAQALEPTICYPTWTKKYYIGREGEYARIAKATELCHRFGISDVFALWSASWGRYQILGSNFLACGYTDVEEMVEAMFTDEDNHLEAFAEYIVNEGIDDELRNGNTVGFVSRYNGPGYARNNYHIKLPAAIRKFEKQNVNCREIMNMQAVEAMPGIRDANPAAEGFANTGLDDRYLPMPNDDEIDLLNIGPSSAATAKTPATEKPANGEPANNGEPASVSPQPLPPTNAGDVPPPPTPDSAVVPREEDPPGFFAAMWKKITGAAASIGGADTITTHAQSVQAFGIPGEVWAKVFYVIAAVVVIWIVYELYQYFWCPTASRRRTDALIDANKTPNNTVMVIKAEDIAAYEAAGWFVVRRN